MKIEQIKQYFIDLKKLMWPFKWYMFANLLIIFLFFVGYFNPPAADDPIWHAEATRGCWNYTNREIYVESIKYKLYIYILIFLFGISNMRNYPRMAKLIFLSPCIFWIGITLLFMLGIEVY